MNTKSSPLLIVLHYVGLSVLALFTFVGLSFLSGNVITGIVGAILLATLVEIVTANLRKRKIQSAQSYNSSTMLPILWGVYALLFLLSAPILLHGFSVGVVERGKIEQECTVEVESLTSYINSLDNKLKAMSDADSLLTTKERIDNKAKKPYSNAKKNLQQLKNNQGEALKQTTLNPFNFLFFFERDFSDYNAKKKEVLQSLKTLNMFNEEELNRSLNIDIGTFDSDRIAWGASLVFLIIVHILILWQVYNISVSGPGKIRGGNSAPGVHTFGR